VKIALALSPMALAWATPAPAPAILPVRADTTAFSADSASITADKE
jgi:hypothetical protein